MFTGSFAIPRVAQMAFDVPPSQIGSTVVQAFALQADVLGFNFQGSHGSLKSLKVLKFEKLELSP